MLIFKNPVSRKKRKTRKKGEVEWSAVTVRY